MLLVGVLLTGFLGSKAEKAERLPYVLRNGYKFLCCSAHPILVAHITKGYPKWINQQGCALPRSPSLFSASCRYSPLPSPVLHLGMAFPSLLLHGGMHQP